MSKVLYISNYHEQSGYSEAARNYILALDSVGINVVPRRINITGSLTDVPTRILELEKGSDKKPDVIIQHVLPHMFHFSPTKNILLFAWETDSFRDSCWTRHLNMADEVWCICNSQMEACRKSGVTVPIQVVPHAVDINKFMRSYPPFELPTNNFIFYWIAELNSRKNLTSFLQAFHAEFTGEPVSCLIKTHIPGMSSDDAYRLVSQKCNEIKIGMKKFKDINLYSPELIIVDKLKDEKMYALHRRCDCFVSTSRGEAFCLPFLDASGFGKPIIVPDSQSFKDYVSETQRVKTHKTQVYGMINSLDDLYTCNETWDEVDILDLRRKMRMIYDNEYLRKRLSKENIANAQLFSYEKIGNLMKGLLCSTT